MKRWPTKTLGELVSLEYGKALKAEERSSNGRFPVFGSNGIVGAFDRALVNEPTSVVGRKGAIGESHLTENGCWPIDTAFYTVLRERNTVSLRFLLLWFRSVDFKSLAITSTIPGLNRNTLYSQHVPVPPLAEQERIVKLLDEADELRKLRAQADRRTAALIPSLFQEMFGDPVINPMGWVLATFGEVGECRLGKMLDAKRQTGLHRRSYLRNVNVQWGRFDLSEVLKMDFDEKDRDVFRLRAGDILICEGGEVGRAAIWNDELPECYFQKALHRARPNPKLAIPEYVQWLMLSLSKSGGLRDFTSQATIAHLTAVKLKTLRIPLPPLPLQREFAAHVSEILAMQAEQSASRRRLDDLFHSLLHRAFQGQL